MRQKKLKFLNEMIDLTPEERVIESDRLYLEVEIINPKPWKPFWKSFNSFKEFELWKKEQKDPRLW